MVHVVCILYMRGCVWYDGKCVVLLVVCFAMFDFPPWLRAVWEALLLLHHLARLGPTGIGRFFKCASTPDSVPFFFVLLCRGMGSANSTNGSASSPATRQSHASRYHLAIPVCIRKKVFYVTSAMAQKFSG